MTNLYKFHQISCGITVKGCNHHIILKGCNCPLFGRKKNSKKNVQSSAFSLRNSYAIPIVMIGAAPCPAKRDTSPICYLARLFQFSCNWNFLSQEPPSAGLHDLGGYDLLFQVCHHYFVKCWFICITCKVEEKNIRNPQKFGNMLEFFNCPQLCGFPSSCIFGMKKNPHDQEKKKHHGHVDRHLNLGLTGYFEGCNHGPMAWNPLLLIHGRGWIC